MRKKIGICLISVALLITGCGSNNETPTTVAPTTTEQVTEDKTTVAETEAPSTEASTPERRGNLNGMSDIDAKSADIKKAGMLYVAINAALADEKAFEEVYEMAGIEGISIKPESDGSFTYYFPKGRTIDYFFEVLEKNMADKSFDFAYTASTWQPEAWFFMFDKDFNVNVYIATTDKRTFQMSPILDSHYNFSAQKNFEKEMKANDVVTAAKIRTAFVAALADEEGYVEFDKAIGHNNGFSIEPYSDGSYNFVLPEGVNLPKVKAIMDEKLRGVNLYFNYCSNDWDPYYWHIYVDNRYSEIYVGVARTDGKLVELSPNVDDIYNYD